MRFWSILSCLHCLRFKNGGWWNAHGRSCKQKFQDSGSEFGGDASDIDFEDSQADNSDLQASSLCNLVPPYLDHPLAGFLSKLEAYSRLYLLLSFRYSLVSLQSVLQRRRPPS